MRKKIRSYIIVGCLFALIPFALHATDHKYVASKFSIKYHLPTCKRALRIQEQNKVTFDTAEEAVKAGYFPCSVCKPPTKDKGQDILGNQGSSNFNPIAFR
jgi:hypothetical protein